ncbi:MarR family winged helix-turn-helix transcriptional regulator [Chryseobacterium sp. T20]|uniref:MarR family winged helix-turn-helix transcriptional regulator n=1 Tax=Chryseobacterium sp. T20 TaxID=3395375 RepID=UPI0039BD0523
MNFDLIKSVVELVQKFTEQNEDKILYNNDLQGFIQWINASFEDDSNSEDPLWIGKELGRSSDSVINTLFVRIGRYAKMYSRSIGKSFFSSQDDFIYMISLKAMGAMTKMELIRHNVSEKSTGVLIINRLIHNQWIEQTVSQKDKRTKHITITEKGIAVLEEHMEEIRKASKAVVGNLTHSEQMLLIAILSKLDEFHASFYQMNLANDSLLDVVNKKLS